MSNLTRSFVRGFGGYLGVMTAKSLMNASSSNLSYSPPSPYKTTALQKVLIVVLWIATSATTHRMWQNPQEHEMFNALVLLFGWLPYWISLRTYNYFRLNEKFQEEKKLILLEEENQKNILRSKIDELMTELKQYPFINLDENWTENRETASLEKMNNIYKPLYNVISQVRALIAKGYNNDTICNIINEELWLGMTEQHTLDMKGEPTKIERETLKNNKIRTTYIYGNKTSGDVLKFEDGILVSFKDR